jgi:hypothetical protein
LLPDRELLRDEARLARDRELLRDVVRLAVERPAALRRVVPFRLGVFVFEERASRFCNCSMSRSRALLSLPLSRRASRTNLSRFL